MIQIASEVKIGLFHIGIHEGQTTDDIIAPSLRKIIESPDIVKVGVKIFMGDADLLRLRIHLKLQSRGAFELSHLYRLITFGPKWPNCLMTYLQALGKQVQEILGLPLNKDPRVRMSNWNQPLSAEQRVYAADDAYAGLMLYHCMNAKRANMLPASPGAHGVLPSLCWPRLCTGGSHCRPRANHCGCILQTASPCCDRRSGRQRKLFDSRSERTLHTLS